jgi:hypothetical protein
MARVLAAATVVTLLLVGLLAGPGPLGAVERGLATPSETAVTDRAGEADRSPAMDGASDAGGPQIELAARRIAEGDAIGYELRVTDMGEAASVWLITTDARMVERTGLEATATPDRYRWDGQAATAELTVAPTGDESADGSLSTAGSDWTFGPTPAILVAWRSADGTIHRVDPLAERAAPNVHVRSSGGGVIGDKFAMVGRTAVHTRATERGTVRLVVPDSVAPRAHPDAVLDAIAAADETFAADGDSDTMTVFVLPRSVRDGGATFIRSDETWVNAGARLQTANNVWLHEYVHTRQAFDLGPRMGWFGEASAEYFGAVLARDAGLASERAYRAYLSGRTRSTTALATPDAWADDSVPYHRGVSVLAALDHRLRDRTGGEYTLEDVFARMNAHEGTVTYEVFARILSTVAGEDLEPWLDRHVAGTATVDRPAGAAVGASDGDRPVAATLVGVTMLSGFVLRRRSPR